MVDSALVGIQGQHIEFRESHPAFLNVHNVRSFDNESIYESPAQRSYHEALAINSINQAYNNYESLFDYLLDWSRLGLM